MPHVARPIVRNASVRTATRSCAFSALLVCLCQASGCGPSAQTISDEEAKVLAKIGDAAVSSVSLVTGDFDVEKIKATEDALAAIMNSPPTVAERIAACRRQAGGTPAELQLAGAAEIPNLTQSFGPSRGKTSRRNSQTQSEIDYFVYGNLELGIDGGVIVAIIVNK